MFLIQPNDSFSAVTKGVVGLISFFIVGTEGHAPCAMHRDALQRSV